MTELEKVREMLDRAGLSYEVISPAPCISHAAVCTSLRIIVESGHTRNHGYLGFYSELNFNSDGLLVCVGSWEG